MIDRLSEFGYNFQIKLIASLIEDKTFLQQIHDILHAEYFESEANQEIIKFIKDYFVSYSTTPTLEAFKCHVTQLKSEVLKSTIVEHLKDVWKHLDSTDLIYIKEQTLEFCKNQHLKGAILESVELLEDGKYDDIKVKIDEAMKAGTEKKLGYEYLLDVDQRYEATSRITLPTRWPIINDVMDGGLAAGELGVFLGAPGGGKSWLLQSVAAFAVTMGKTVLHYTLELDEFYTGKRFDALLSGVPFQNLKHNIEEVKRRLEHVKGKLFIEFYPEYSITVNNIKTQLEKYRLLGVFPDLLILDYADCLKPIMIGKRERSDQVIGDIYTMLKGLAQEYRIPIWTASQVGRTGSEAEVIEGTHVSESFIKIMKADFIVSVSRKVEDKIAGTGRMHIIKNRFGPDGMTFPSKINFSNGNIEIYEGGTVEGKETQHKIDNKNEYARKYLSNKFKELSGGSKNN